MIEVPVWKHAQVLPFQLVLEGGAMRGMFTCGVLDFFLDHGLLAESVVGVSMGASCGFSYASGVPGQTAKVVMAYRNDRRFISLRSKLTTGDLVGSRFIYETIPDELDHVPTWYFADSPIELVTVATNVETGEADYHVTAKQRHPQGDPDRERGRRYMMATSAMPFANRMVQVDGKRLLDGGIVQSVPFAYGRGGVPGYDGAPGRTSYAGRQVVVLTQPRGFRPQGTTSARLARAYYRRYPQLVERMRRRNAEYACELSEVEALHENGELFAVWPEAALPASMAEKNPDKLLATYEAGLQAAADCWDSLLAFLHLG